MANYQTQFRLLWSFRVRLYMGHAAIRCTDPPPSGLHLSRYHLFPTHLGLPSRRLSARGFPINSPWHSRSIAPHHRGVSRRAALSATNWTRHLKLLLSSVILTAFCCGVMPRIYTYAQQADLFSCEPYRAYILRCIGYELLE